MVTFFVTFSAVMSFYIPAAFAQGASDGGAYANVKQRCKQIKQEIVSSDKDGIVLSEYIVECTKTIVKEVFTQFINGFYPAVKKAIVAALTLAVTLFGVLQLTQALEKPGRDAFVGLFKLSCVLFFVLPDTVQQIFDMGLEALDGLTDLVFQFGKNTTSQRCFDNDTVWDRVDCMLDVLIGLKGTDSEAKSLSGFLGGAGGDEHTGAARGLMHFATTSLFSAGGMGALIGLLTFYIAYTMVMATVKSVHTYLAAVVGIAFVLVFAPLFVPMIMFRLTKQFFDKWQRIATSFVLQPVILFGFLSFMMIAMDKMLIADDGSLLKTAFGEKADSKKEVPGELIERAGALGTKAMSGLFTPQHFIGNRPNAGKEDVGMFTTYDSPIKNTPGSRQVSSGLVGAHVFSYDFAKLCDGKKADAAKCSEAIAYTTLVVALTAFVFISMLNYIPNLATDLAGGMYEVPSLYDEVGQKLPGKEMLEQRFKAGAAGAQGRFKKAIEHLVTQRPGS